MVKKKRFWVVVVALAVVIGFPVTLFMAQHNENVKAEEKKEAKIQAAKKAEKDLINRTTSSIQSLFADKKQTKLADTYTPEVTVKLERQVFDISSETARKNLQKQLNQAKQLYDQVVVAQKQVAALFKDKTKTVLVDEINAQMIENAEKIQKNTPQEKAKKALQSDIEKAKKLFQQINAAKESPEKRQPKEGPHQGNQVKSNQNGGSGSPDASSNTSSGPQKSATSSNVSRSTSPSYRGNSQPLVAKMNVANRTDQIITVVASGSSAQVKLWQKTSGSWRQTMSTYGHVGSQGVGSGSEYASRTPRGAYGLSFAFGTHNPGTKLGYRQITKNSYWISNVNDRQYNTWQERPNGSHAKDERLLRYPVQYEYAIALSYNNGVGGGSAIFLHVDNGRPTAGCISVPRSNMQYLMQTVHGGAYIVNVTSEQELLNY